MRLFCYQFVTRIALSNKKISIFAIGNKIKHKYGEEETRGKIEGACKNPV